MPTPISISTITGEVSAHVPGCPTPVVEAAMRKVITDLCQRAKVWTTDLAPIALVAGTHTYPLVSPVVYGEIVEVARARVDGVTAPLLWASPSDFDLLYPDEVDGEPQRFTTRITETTIDLAPTPTSAGALLVTVVLRPTMTAAQWDLALYREFSRCVFHGALHELYDMPQRSWTNHALATANGRVWTNLVSEARWRQDTGYTRGALRVEARPFA